MKYWGVQKFILIFPSLLLCSQSLGDFYSPINNGADKEWISDRLMKQNRSRILAKKEYLQGGGQGETNPKDGGPGGSPDTHHSDMEVICLELAGNSGDCTWVDQGVSRHGFEKGAGSSSSLEGDMTSEYVSKRQGQWVYRTRNPGDQAIDPETQTLIEKNLSSLTLEEGSKKKATDDGNQTAEQTSREARQIFGQTDPKEMDSYNSLQFEALRNTQILQDYFKTRVQEIRDFKEYIRFPTKESPEASTCLAYYNDAMARHLEDGPIREGTNLFQAQKGQNGDLKGDRTPRGTDDPAKFQERLRLCEEMERKPISMVSPVVKDGQIVSDPSQERVREALYRMNWEMMEKGGLDWTEAHPPEYLQLTKEDESQLVTNYKPGGLEIESQRMETNAETLTGWNNTLAYVDKLMVPILKRAEVPSYKGTQQYQEGIGQNGRPLRDIDGFKDSVVQNDLAGTRAATELGLQATPPDSDSSSGLAVTEIQ